jgi:hypothetical protein
MYYKAYCKLLSNYITEAKRSYYDRLIMNSNNKITSTLKITKSETGRMCANEGIVRMNVNGHVIDNSHAIYSYL